LNLQNEKGSLKRELFNIYYRKKIFLCSLKKIIKIINQNLFIMKKTLFISVLLLSGAFLFAQTNLNLQPRSFVPEVKIEKGIKKAIYKVRGETAIVYQEGFESTTEENLPQDWTRLTTSSSWGTGSWQSYCNTVLVTGIENPVGVHTGSRALGRSWAFAGPNTWAFSCPISLKGGSPYKIEFWYRAPGYPSYSEYDNFEVKIGKEPTVNGMASAFEVLKVINDRITEWTLLSKTFTPTDEGIYYLAFHCLTPPNQGLIVCIDDITIEGESNIDCEPVSDFSVNFTSECKAELTWTASEGAVNKYEVFRDGVLLTALTSTSYLDNNFDPSESHFWQVRAVCASGINTELKSVSKDPCANCPVLSNFNVIQTKDENDKCVANLSWNAPTSLYVGNMAQCTIDEPQWALSAREVMDNDI
jgi:hypothetical protein